MVLRPGDNDRAVIVLDWERSPSGWRTFIHPRGSPNPDRFDILGSKDSRGFLNMEDSRMVGAFYLADPTNARRPLTREDLLNSSHPLYTRCAPFDLVIENAHLVPRTEDSLAQVYTPHELNQLYEICQHAGVEVFLFPNVVTKRARMEANYRTYSDMNKSELVKVYQTLSNDEENVSGRKKSDLIDLIEGIDAEENSTVSNAGDEGEAETAYDPALFPKHHDPDAICFFILRRVLGVGPENQTIHDFNPLVLKKFNPLIATPQVFWDDIAKIRMDSNKRLNRMRNIEPKYGNQDPDVKRCIEKLNAFWPSLKPEERRLFREKLKLAKLSDRSHSELKNFLAENRLDVYPEEGEQLLGMVPAAPKPTVESYAELLHLDSSGTTAEIRGRILNTELTPEMRSNVVSRLIQDGKFPKKGTILEGFDRHALEMEPFVDLPLGSGPVVMSLYVSIFERNGLHRRNPKGQFIGIGTIFDKVLNFSPYKGRKGGLARSNLMWHSLGKAQMNERWVIEDDMSSRQDFRRDWRRALKILTRKLRGDVAIIEPPKRGVIRWILGKIMSR